MAEKVERSLGDIREAIRCAAGQTQLADIRAGQRLEGIARGGIGHKAGERQRVAILGDGEIVGIDAWRLERRGAAETCDDGRGGIGDAGAARRAGERGGGIAETRLPAFEREQRFEQGQRLVGETCRFT